ncbi:hypothetical protein DL98DRAFT_533933 [Cadophora sp. DSE1049]|nr:hypothetical protein DL98DRAFT_533933 [Cadophora sp. DSE1049]
MSTSGVKHFTDKYGIVKRHSYGMKTYKKERDELDLRLAIPYRDCKRTMFARSALRKISTVLQNDHRTVCRYIRVSKNAEGTIDANHNYQTNCTEALESKQMGEQIPGTSTKRSRTDGEDSARPAKIQKTTKQGLPEDDLDIETRRLGRLTEALEKLNSLSRRYNGPDGYIIPTLELKLYNQKMDSEQAEQKSTTTNPRISRRLPLPKLREKYLKKLDIKTSHTIRNWRTPTAKLRPCLSQEEQSHALYGPQQQNAMNFILTTVERRMTANDFFFLADIILKAKYEDLEALASNIESYETSINNEHFKPQILDFNELDIQQCAAERWKWHAWTTAKTAANVAEEVVGLKVDIADVIREIEGNYGPTNCLLPGKARPLKALPLHMRANNTRRARDGSCTVGGFGDIVPSKGFSLEIHARSVSRSKLSNVVASAEEIDEMGMGRVCQILTESASTEGISTMIKWRSIIWDPEP